MKNAIRNKKILIAVLCVIMFISAIASGLCAIYNNSEASSSSNQITLYDDDGWNSSGFKSLLSQFGSLLSTESGSSVDIDSLSSYIDANGAVKAKDIVKSDWSVLLGGIEFTAVYLSEDDNSNVILTFWQSTGDKFVQFNDSYSTSTSVSPVSNQYSTSYVRTYGLNNSGVHYSYADGVTSEEEYTASQSHTYALFTTGEIADYIVSPKDVSWQFKESDSINDLSFDDNTAYSGNKYYQKWGEDKLWLPSYYEVLNDWSTTEAQRKNDYSYWLRSAKDEATSSNVNPAYQYAYTLNNYGVSASASVDTTNVLRPAFHLNLTAVSKIVASTTGYEETKYADDNTATNYINAFTAAWNAAFSNNSTTDYDTYFYAKNTDATSTDTYLSWNAAATPATENTAEKSGTLVARVYYDGEETYSDGSAASNNKNGVMVFKMYADWGAISASVYISSSSTITSTSFCGDMLTASALTNNFYYGALCVPADKSLKIDLNGHVINRNLYSEADFLTFFQNAPSNYTSSCVNYVGYDSDSEKYYTVSNSTNTYYDDSSILDSGITQYFPQKGGLVLTGQPYGFVIMLQGNLTIDDSSVKNNKYVKCDDNGIAGVGRITGGCNTTVTDGIGGGITTSATQIGSVLNVKQGALCYNSSGGLSFGYGGVLSIKSTCYCPVYITGGVFSHNYLHGYGSFLYLGGFNSNGCDAHIKNATIAYNVNGLGYQTSISTTSTSTGGISTGTIHTRFNTNTKITLDEGCVFHDNYAIRGAVVYLNRQESSSGLHSTFNINGGEYYNNYALLGGAVGYLAYGSSSEKYNSATVTGGMFYNNETYSNGAIFYCDEYSVLEVSGGTFLENIATGGTFSTSSIATLAGNGGCFYMGTNSTVTMTGGTFTGNSCKGDGGGVYMGTGSTFTMSGGTFENNTADGNGGGVYMADGTFTMSGGTFKGNTAGGNGGGVYMTNGAFNMTGGTFTGNYAAGTGGAVYMSGGTMNLNAASGTPIYFTDNSADEYPGFYCKSITISGELHIKGNKANGVEQNVYLADKEDYVYVSGALSSDGYIGVTKTVSSSVYDKTVTKKENNNEITYYMITVAQPSTSDYTMTTEDLLCLHCDAGSDKLFTVDSNKIYLSVKEAHSHTYTSYTVDPTCETPGYTVSVCTGCQEIKSTDGTLNVSYTSPKGHTYVYDSELNCFVCSESECGDTLYYEIPDISSVPFDGTEKTPTVELKLYYLSEDGTKTYLTASPGDVYDGVRYYTGSLNCSYSYNVNVGTATVSITFNNNSDNGFCLVQRGKYTVPPYGSHAGEVTSNTYKYTCSFSFPENGTVKNLTKNFEITKNTPIINFTTPGGNYYAADSDSFFSRLTYTASVKPGDVSIDTLGELQWYIDQAWVSANKNHPALKSGTNTYKWRWVPKTENADNTNNLETVEGEYEYTALEAELYALIVDKKDSDALDDKSWEKLKSHFTVQAQYIIDNQNNTILKTITDYTVKLIDSAGNYYDRLRPGDFRIVFSYTDGGVTKTYTSPEYKIYPQNVDSISASLNKDANGKDYVIYDTLTDLEDLTDYITVTAVTGQDEYGKDITITITGYTLSCENWGGAGEKTVTVSYAQSSSDPVTCTLPVTVKANDLSSMTAEWTQTGTPNTSNSPQDILTFGTLNVTVTYLDGTEREIGMSLNGSDGYEVSGSFEKVGYNTITLKYTEYNARSDKTSSVSATIKVQVFAVEVSDVTYTVNSGSMLFSDEKVSTLPKKITVYAVYTNGTKTAINPETEGATGLYYKIGACSYNSVTNELTFTIYVYEYGVSDYVTGKTFTVTPSEKAVTSITAETTQEFTQTNPLYETTSLEEFKASYLKITEIWNDGEEVVAYSPSDTSAADRVTLTLPSAQNGKFKVGINTVTVTYTDAKGNVFTDTVTLYVGTVTLAKITVAIKDVYDENGDKYGYDKNGDEVLDENWIFTSSSLDDIKKYITVTGYFTDESSGDLTVTQYTISGSLTAGEQEFTVKATVTASDGVAYSKTETFKANVTNVALESISAVFEQGDKVIYENTAASELTGLLTVTAKYNDGSTAPVNSGFTVTVNNGSGFSLEGTNTLTVKYGEKNCTAEGDITVSKKQVSYITVESRQGTVVIYPSAGEATISAYITVTAYYTDGTDKVLIYNNNDINYTYTFSGSLKENNLKVTYTYEGKTVEADVIGVIKVTPLQVNTMSVTANLPTSYYQSFGLDGLKNYITVNVTYNDGSSGTLTYNDGSSGTLNYNEYTLSIKITNSDGTISTSTELAVGDNTITVTSSNGVTADFTVSVVATAVSRIISVKGNQNDTIYASVSLEYIKTHYFEDEENKKQYLLVVTVELTDGTTTTLAPEDYTLTGWIKDDGTYSLTVTVKSASGDLTANITSEDNNKNPTLKLTPITPDTVTAASNQGDNVIYAGTNPNSAAVKQYITVKVKYNDGSTGTLSADEYTLSGSLSNTDTAKVEACTLTVSYTYNGVTKTAEVKLNVTARQVTGINVEYDSPEVYYSQAFDPTNAEKLNSALKSTLSNYITVYNVYNNGDTVKTTDYTLSGYTINDEKTLADLKVYGGVITVTVTSDNYYKNVTNEDGKVSQKFYTDTFELKVVAVAPESLTVSVKEGTTIYSSFTNAKVKDALTVTVNYNDGTTKTLTSDDFTVTLPNGFALGGTHTIEVTYTETTKDSSDTVLTVNTAKGSVEVTVVKVVVTGITVTTKKDESGNDDYTLYTSSSEQAVRKVLTVTATYNDGTSGEVTDYSITSGFPFTSIGENELTISYTYGNSTVTNTDPVKVTVKDIGVGSIEVDKSKSELFDGENQIKAVYTAQSLDDVKQYIIVTAYGNDEAKTDLGEVNDYTLSLGEGEVWGEDTFTVTVTYSGKTDTFTATFSLTVTQSKLDEDKPFSVTFAQGDLTVYSDYELSEIESYLKEKLTITPNWNDELSHPEYITTVTGITDNGITTNENSEKVGNFTATYTYARKGETVTENNTYTYSFTVTLTEPSVNGINVKVHESYDALYTSQDPSKDPSIIKSVADLYLVYNSGKEEQDEWAEYAVTCSSSDWKNGGEVEVTVTVTVGEKTYSKTVTVNVTEVELTGIEASWTQSATIYSSATANNILANGSITLNGTYNDGTEKEDIVTVTADMLSFTFDNETKEQTVTVTYSGLECTFKVNVTKVEVSEISVALINEAVKIYENSDVNTLKNKITVTATYNDKSTGTLSADEYDLSAPSDYVTTVNNSDGTVSYLLKEGTYEVTVTSNGKTKTIEVTVTKATLISISASYTQDGELYASSALNKVPDKLIVNGTYETEAADATTGTQQKTEVQSLQSNQYTVKYLVNGTETAIPDEDGTITLTVVVNADESISNTFTITITKKAQNGITVEYTANQTIYTTTLLQELVEKVGDVAAKGTLLITYTYNDGTYDKTKDTVNASTLTFGEGYTLSGDLSKSGTVTVTCNGFTATFDVEQPATPKINSITAAFEGGYTVYTGVTDLTSHLIVTAAYDDDHTEAKTLTANQYTLDADVTTVGTKTFTVTLYDNSKISCTIENVTVYQLITANTTVTPQYRKSGTSNEWKDFPNVGLYSDTVFELRLQFTAEDGNGTAMYVMLDTSSYTSAEQWVAGTELKFSYSKICNSDGSDYDGGLYVIESGLQYSLTLKQKTLEKIVATYTPADNQTIYETTTGKELVENVTTDEKTVTAKGTLTFTLVYNNEEEETVTLIYGTDYTLSENAIGKGENEKVTVNVNITKYSKTASFEVTVKAVKVTEAKVEWKDNFSLVYGGSEDDVRNNLTATVNAYNDDHTATGTVTDYTLEFYSDYSEGNYTGKIDNDKLSKQGVGTVYVKVIFLGEYTVESSFEITAKPLTDSDCTATLPADVTYTYDGTAKTPEITVKDGETKLDLDTDYTVTYTGNTNAGTETATVTITGKGNYSGEVTLNFKITAFELTSDNVASIADQTYTGSAITPEITVKNGETKLTPDTDYTVTYANNTNAGQATVTINGIGNYSGTVEVYFTITAFELTSDNVASIADQTYTGSAITPEPAVTVGGKTLNKGIDFEYSYGDNNTNVSTEEAKATVTIKGIGNYSGEFTVYFTISPLTLTADNCNVASIADQTYTGSAITPEITVKNGETKLTLNTDYTVTYTGNTNAGQATVTITGIGNYSGTVESSFEITAKSLTDSDCKATLPADVTYTYDGTAKTPEITVKDGETTLTDTDYTVTYTGNTNAGQATVTINGIGNYSGTVTLNFTINKASLTVTADDKQVREGKAAPEYTCTISGFAEGEDESVLGGTLSFACSYTDSAAADATFDIIPSGYTSENYDITYVKGTLTVLEKLKEVTLKDNSLSITEKSSASGDTVKYLNKVTESSTLSSVVSHFDAEGLTVKATSVDGVELGLTDVVGTGTVIQFYDGDSLVTELTVTVTGDLNGDGEIDILDLVNTQQIILEMYTAEDTVKTVSDVNADGVTDILDLVNIQQHILGMLDTFAADATPESYSARSATAEEDVCEVEEQVYSAPADAEEQAVEAYSCEVEEQAVIAYACEVEEQVSSAPADEEEQANGCYGKQVAAFINKAYALESVYAENKYYII